MTALQHGFIIRYPTLSTQDQIGFLLNIIYRLSFEGRGTYVAGGYGLTDPERLRTINEALHRIADHGAALIKDKQPRRTDADVVKLLLEILATLNLSPQIFDDVMSKI